jgi:mRNA interferase RelE/StbE
MTYRIIIEPTAMESLRGISDRLARERIRDRIDGLAEEPAQQGKALVGELAGYRSIRAVGQRYGIIYRVEARKVLVLVVAIGIRKAGDKKDVYALARRLLRLRLLEPPRR